MWVMTSRESAANLMVSNEYAAALCRDAATPNGMTSFIQTHPIAREETVRKPRFARLF